MSNIVFSFRSKHGCFKVLCVKIQKQIQVKCYATFLSMPFRENSSRMYRHHILSAVSCSKWMPLSKCEYVPFCAVSWHQLLAAFIWLTSSTSHCSCVYHWLKWPAAPGAVQHGCQQQLRWYKNVNYLPSFKLVILKQTTLFIAKYLNIILFRYLPQYHVSCLSVR